MIFAKEKGRNLEITVGGGEDAIVLTIAPIKAALGSQLLAKWVDTSFNAAPDQDQLVQGAVDMAQLAVGDVYDQLDELRAAEAEGVMLAAFFWNVTGGGIDLVQEYLADGYPKARETLLRGRGLWDAVSQLETSLALVSADPELMARSLATTTRSGGGSSFGPAADKPTAESTESDSGDSSSPTGTTA